ncbi:MAG: hypothetical protein COW12_01810, partial [Candidatus Omnitrophica bacterium CG12_big_fil_rev_8_21_14_0_65_45_16]
MDTYAKGRVYKRGRIWCLDYCLNGIRQRESAKTTNKAVAERLLNQKLNLIDEGSYVHMSKVKKVQFSSYVERYLTTYSNGRVSWSVGKKRLFKPLKNFFGGKALRDITPALIADYRAKRITDQVNIRGSRGDRLVQPSTVNRELATLNALLNKALAEGILVANPCQQIQKLKFSESGRARERFLDEDEIKRLLSAAGYPLKQILVIALGTGMRRGELMGLRWQDISIRDNDDFGLITLRHTKNGETRKVIMSQSVKKAILSIQKHPDSDLLFPGSNSRTPWDFRKPLELAVKKAGLNAAGKEKFVFHHLRHTFCSQLGLLGYDVKTIMELSGHKSYQMVLRYTKLNNAHKVRALERLDAKLGCQRPNVSAERETLGTKT